MRQLLTSLFLFALCGTSLAQGWSAQNSGTTNPLTAVHFPDAQNGWAVGFGGIILHTSDGGQTWAPQTSSIPAPLYSVYFLDAQTGWVSGEGSILRTTDGGVTWSWQASPAGITPESIHFTDALHGWVVGLYSHPPEIMVLRTTNGGITWTPLIFTNPNATYHDIFFLDTQTGWIVGENGLEKTTDGGATWTNQAPAFMPNFDLFSVWFVDANTGWVAGTNGTILKTTNGGNSWQGQFSGITQSIQNAFFSDTMHGWATGKAGKIIHTTDGGQTWVTQNSGVTLSMTSICFADTLNGWAVGSGGTILHTTTGGSPVANKTLVSSPTFSIYPNPAEEYITLQTHSPIRELTIVDNIGRVIGPQNVAALQKNRLDISSMQPGIYSIRIKTVDGVAVQRVLKE